MKARGIAFKYGDNIDTDIIIPARYLNVADARELAAHALEGLDPSFAARVRPGSIVVAGRNFGSGSSREHAPLAIKESGVSCVVAESFARIFYRNAINIGLPILECEEASRFIGDGDEVEVDFETGAIADLTRGSAFQAQPFPDFIQDIIRRGGLIASLKANGD